MKNEIMTILSALVFGSSFAGAQVITKTEDSPSAQALAETLIQKHFRNMNDRNSSERRKRFEEIYSKEFYFADTSMASVGFEGITSFIDHVQSGHAGFVFSPISVTLNHGIGCAIWNYGPKEDPKRILGEDIFTIENGKLASMRVFLISKPKTN